MTNHRIEEEEEEVEEEEDETDDGQIKNIKYKLVLAQVTGLSDTQ